MISGLNYRTIPDALQQGLRERMAERPEFAAVSTAMQPAPMQGGLAAAAPVAAPGFENFNANFMQDLRSQMQLAARDNPGLAGARSLVGAVPYEMKDVPAFSFASDNFALGPNTFQPIPGRNYRLMNKGELVGESSDPATIMELVREADALSASQGELADYKFEEQRADGGYSSIRAVEPPSFQEKLGKMILPAALAAMSGGLLAEPLALGLGAKAGAGGTLTGGVLGAGKSIGAGLATGVGSTVGNLGVGNPLGQSLKSGALTGLTAGALGALGGASGFDQAAFNAAQAKTNAALQDIAGSTVAGLPAAAVPALGNIISGTTQTAASELAEVIAEASRFPNAVPTGALANLPDVIAQAIAQQSQPTSQEQAPETTDDQIDILANRFPDAVPTGALANIPSVIAAELAFQAANQDLPEIKTEADRIREELRVPPLPFTPASLIVPQVPDLAVQPDVAPVDDDQIVVTASPSANILTDGIPPIPDIAAIGALSLGSVPPAPPPKTPLQKALTTGGRVLTGLSILGGLAGGGRNRNAPGLGTGAAAIGTRASLDPVFGRQLPTASGIFAPQSMAPRVMSDIDFERYGYGPARSFFENVPETPEQYRAALAANAPRPMETDAGTVGVPNFLSNFIPPSASSPAVQAVRRLAPGVSDVQIEAFLATPEGADFLAAIQESQSQAGADFSVAPDSNNSFARGGTMANKGRGKPSRDSYAVNGAGTGRSDEIPALLSDGEYVIDAETVAMLGDGSGKAGAKRLDDLRVKIRKHKGRNLAKGRFSDNAKAPEKYLSGGRT